MKKCDYERRTAYENEEKNTYKGMEKMLREGMKHIVMI
jgi:hypothetical protein